MPSTISVLLTPRVSFCAAATPTSATAPTTTATINPLFIGSPSRNLASFSHHERIRLSVVHSDALDVATLRHQRRAPVRAVAFHDAPILTVGLPPRAPIPATSLDTRHALRGHHTHPFPLRCPPRSDAPYPPRAHA